MATSAVIKLLYLWGVSTEILTWFVLRFFSQVTDEVIIIWLRAHIAIMTICVVTVQYAFMKQEYLRNSLVYTRITWNDLVLQKIPDPLFAKHILHDIPEYNNGSTTGPPHRAAVPLSILYQVVRSDLYPLYEITK
ncbi:hypothetical protein BDV33DRAFT_103228 [Aspergillus novoparasiticus]|uniref:Uncharacterized protein n=1 Tax=Aspergillus novoparasiticus TaxID=986946 RepID=A0A5N6ES48_9EURO|nr:hypothetical protein BDV33DRAFT_103228 [Aspergillus novoparasiticus]